MQPFPSVYIRKYVLENKNASISKCMHANCNSSHVPNAWNGGNVYDTQI